MDSQQFREFGKAAIDLVADYIDNIRERDVLPSIEPGYLIDILPENAPEEPGDWRDVIKDFNQIIMPGVTHWHSPRFHAFYPTGASYASMVGNILSDGLGVIGFSWLSSPACTELEVVTMNWLGKMLGLPEEFLNCSPGRGGGIIQGSASEATLVGLLVAKEKTVRRLLKQNPSLDEGSIKAKLIAYTSDQCNSSVEKSGLLGSMTMRLLKSDADGRLRGDTLKKAFKEDLAQGLIPCYVVANLGTTGTCAFDPLYELGPICNEYDVWLHVDAAYAGAAFICPEYRHLMKGVEFADSFDFNPHKWLLVNFDCSAMWVKDGLELIKTFDVQRIYLDDIKTDTKVPDYRHWQIPLGRRFRALKLWTVINIYGAEGLRKHIRNQIDLAQHFAKLVRSDDRFVIEPEPSMGLVCFRLKDGDKITKSLLENLTKKKKVFMVAGAFRGRYIIRFVVCSRLTKREDIDFSWNNVKYEADLICKPEIHNKPKIPALEHIETITISEKSK
ncbi:3,4-dihydroxyphenylacetaldehyde synthase-like [Ostrinia furnacalis]|uniref:3,4-dihydroxyphenylacetaldehyde synthase-like n=1 Tax=Ostrinia furnacalis TaxID=93504 RepID=UPI001039ADC7|nr:3,4-dihydroxyphenylacetaldehyde synthase-like [Ostrinia furnacalis]